MPSADSGLPAIDPVPRPCDSTDAASDASLTELARRLVEISDRQGRLPVLRSDTSVELRLEFYTALAAELVAQVGRPVRFDVIAEPQGIRSFPHQLRMRRMARKLAAALPEETSVNLRSLVGRPAGPGRSLAVAIAPRSVSMPGWAEPVMLTTRPTSVDQIQLVPVPASCHTDGWSVEASGRDGRSHRQR